MGSAYSATTLVALMTFGLAVLPAASRAADGSPAPAPSAVASAIPASTGQGSASAAPAAPLPEIGHVRATTLFCTTTLNIADLGIQVALANDLRLQGIEGMLRHVKLDYSLIAKSAALESLRKQYVALREAALAGNSLAKRLRDAAATAPTPEQATAMTSFADALGGASSRQRDMADTVGRAIAVLQNHPMITDEAHEQMLQSAIWANGGYDTKSTILANGLSGPTLESNSHGDDDPDLRVTQVMQREQARLNQGFRSGSPEDSALDTTTMLAGKIASELQERSLPILDDEKTASNRMDAAFKGC